VRERRQRVEANQALLIRRGVAHVYGAAERAPWSIHWVHFLGDDAACFCNLLRADNPVVPVAADLMPRLRGLFREACAALSEGFTQEGIICAAQSVRHLLGLLFFGNSSFHPRTKAPRAEGIERTLEFLRERSEDRVTVAEMARRVDLSVTHFARQFRQHTGFAPMDYFIHLKMQRAARLLTLTPLTVKQVAARVGYDDPYYFSRLFRKIMGAPPTEYRVAKLGCHPSL
jgi:AraC-like DNA-binding protein